MKNQFLLSIVEVSRQYNVPRDKLYAAARAGNTEIPFIKIGTSTKIHVPLFEKLLEEKALNHKELF